MLNTGQRPNMEMKIGTVQDRTREFLGSLRSIHQHARLVRSGLSWGYYKLYLFTSSTSQRTSNRKSFPTSNNSKSITLFIDNIQRKCVIHNACYWALILFATKPILWYFLICLLGKWFTKHTIILNIKPSFSLRGNFICMKSGWGFKLETS